MTRRDSRVRLLGVVALCIIAAVLSGCVSDEAMKEFGEIIAAPLNSIATDLSRSRDLAYAMSAFQRKNGRWPKDYPELSNFVEQTDGLLQVAKYDRVDFIERPEGGLEIQAVIEGRTNQMMFTRKDVQTEPR